MEVKGIVVGKSGGEVIVETQAISACSHCSSTACASSILSALFENRRNRLTVADSMNPRQGQQVSIGIEDDVLVKASIIAYLLPLIIMLVMIACVRALGSGEIVQVATGMAGLASGLLLMHYLTTSNRLSGYFSPRLTRCDDTTMFNRQSVPQHGVKQ